MSSVKEARSMLKGIKGRVAVTIWTEEDVATRAEERDVKLPTGAAGKIIDQVDQHQDAQYGITWDTLDYFTDEWLREHNQPDKGGER